MRQSIGGAWLFSISIILMMFIIAYVTITIDYSNAYQLKDDVALYIEQYNGLNEKSAKLILARIKAKKHTTKIKCDKYYDSSTYYSTSKYDGDPAEWYYGLVNYNTDYLHAFKKNASKSYICIYRYKAVKGTSDTDKIDKYFYSVSTAFGFNFPIIGDICDYRVTGETGTINYNYDKDFEFSPSDHFV